MHEIRRQQQKKIFICFAHLPVVNTKHGTRFVGFIKTTYQILLSLKVTIL